jgi:hypothetical protein
VSHHTGIRIRVAIAVTASWALLVTTPALSAGPVIARYEQPGSKVSTDSTAPTASNGCIFSQTVDASPYSSSEATLYTQGGINCAYAILMSGRVDIFKADANGGLLVNKLWAEGPGFAGLYAANWDSVGATGPRDQIYRFKFTAQGALPSNSFWVPGDAQSVYSCTGWGTPDLHCEYTTYDYVL